MADSYESFMATPNNFGTVAAVVTPSDSTDLTSVAKAIQVTDITAGTVLRVLPVGNADGAWITFTGVYVGFTPSVRVRRVHTDTTCTVISITG